MKSANLDVKFVYLWAATAGAMKTTKKLIKRRRRLGHGRTWLFKMWMANKSKAKTSLIIRDF